VVGLVVGSIRGGSVVGLASFSQPNLFPLENTGFTTALLSLLNMRVITVSSLEMGGYEYLPLLFGFEFSFALNTSTFNTFNTQCC